MFDTRAVIFLVKILANYHNRPIMSHSKSKTYIGCSGFSERLWKGVFYPEDLPSKDFLAFYSQHLNAVEINSTFYRKPTQKTLQNWVNATPADFKFFIKIPKTISHLQKLVDTHDMTVEFCEHIYTGLQDKLAGFLFQLPPSFKYSEENLQKVLATVDSRFVNVVEFRHVSWWCDEVKQALQSANIVMAGVSILLKSADNQIPSEVVINHKDTLYYRLHGVPVMFKSEYSEAELTALAEQIKGFDGQKFVFFNNTFGTAGIKNALFLHKFLNQ